MRIIVFSIVCLAYLAWTLAVDPVTRANMVGHHLSTGVIDFTTFVGAVVVCLFYWIKFNEWAGPGLAPPKFHARPTRFFTTALRHSAWSAAYAGMMVTVYLFIVLFPNLLLTLMLRFRDAFDLVTKAPPEALGLSVDVISKMQGALARGTPGDLAPYAAILVTVFWAGIRPFQEFERRLRYLWQQRASIPGEAREMIEMLNAPKGVFAADTDLVTEMAAQTDGRVSAEDFLAAGSSRDGWARYARAEYVRQLLLRYSAKPLFAPIAERNMGEFADLQQRMDALGKRVSRRIADVCDALRDADKPVEGSNPSFRTAEAWLKALEADKHDRFRARYFEDQAIELSQEVERAWAELLQLVVCSVLAVGHTATHRRQLLNDFGLQEDRISPAHLKPEMVTKVVVATLGVVLLSSFIYREAAQPPDQISPAAEKVSTAGAELAPQRERFIRTLQPQSSVPLSQESIPEARSVTTQIQARLVPRDINDTLAWAVYACAMHAIATLAGFLVQRSFDMRRERLQCRSRYPVSRSDLLAEACWAFAFAAALNVLLLTFLSWRGGNVEVMQHQWWWALVPGVTGFFAALYTQQDRPDASLPIFRANPGHPSSVASSSLRWVERHLPLVQAACTALVTLFVSYAIYRQMVWFTLYAITTTGMVGFALGAIFREWVENDCLVHQTERRGAPRRVVEQAQWIVGGETHPVQRVHQSATGVDLSSRQPLAIGDVGELQLDAATTRKARVSRRYAKEPHRFFLEFVPEPG